ncbi:pseudouridine synthase, RluA family [secondary endosymbiont of Heteropsylla cubana]|uniref:Pseudouridine synthase n=1 Tax=secondary endosymbiont of Heteropsylla cubana TaxID=134287 RepID=J3YSQ8_9ENTR|nr:23S rRNA pseudouridine(1911/1915/1917) synthase RluD [secondary endosymbiont of Heteropsylla cubana]AFP85348.1 pseudouridine synthase, RluA family [secondary endosymbiont of Heteropsylla cubana]
MTHHQHLNGIVSNLQFGQRLDRTLTELFPNYSRSQIKNWILNGLVRINGQVKTQPKEKIRGNEHVEIKYFIKETTPYEAQAIPLRIVYEDNDILVINKQNNLVVHPGAGNTSGTLLNGLLYYFPPILNVPRAGIVHRLDKNTTGLMLIAKSKLVQERLVKSLKAREITREYEAVAIGSMTAGGVIEQPIARHATKRTQMAVNPTGKSAVTHYHIIETFRNHTHLKLQLQTGRTHQIRVHMAYIHHPLVGDSLYGRLRTSFKKTSSSVNNVLRNFRRQALHASMLRFYHPTTFLKIECHAPLPEDMISLISALKTG